MLQTLYLFKNPEVYECEPGRPEHHLAVTELTRAAWRQYALAHGNIIRVLGVVEKEGMPWIVMELSTHRILAHNMPRPPPPPPPPPPALFARPQSAAALAKDRRWNRLDTRCLMGRVHQELHERFKRARIASSLSEGTIGFQCETNWGGVLMRRAQ